MRPSEKFTILYTTMTVIYRSAIFHGSPYKQAAAVQHASSTAYGITDQWQKAVRHGDMRVFPSIWSLYRMVRWGIGRVTCSIAGFKIPTEAVESSY